MATVISVPTLSSSGWVNTPSEKIDYLMTYFVYSIKNQTSLYGTNVTSLQWILEENISSMEDTVSATRSALISYLKHYYDSVSVDVSYALSNPTVSNSLTTMTIAATVTEAGTEYSVQKLLTLLDGKFQAFVTATSQS